MSLLPAPIWEPVKIVYGVYLLRGSHAGDDRWWVQRMIESDDSWMVHNDIYLDRPAKRYITLDVELGEGWEWLYLNLRDEQGNLLSAEVVSGKLVVEWNGTVSEFPFDARSELGFLSPFMTSLTLRRLQLSPGQSETVSTVCFDPDTFAPSLAQQSFTREADRDIEIAGMPLTVQQLRFRHGADPEATLLAREDGLVLHHSGVAELALDERASAGRGRMPPIS